jgi:iron(II)-dependent oxidoreductase
MEDTALAAYELIAWVREARQRTLELVVDLTDEQLMGPRLAIVNPLRWEVAHVAWFQEKWFLRHARGEPPLRADGDALYDSAAIAHDTRWDLPLPAREETLAYVRDVRERVVARLRERPPTPEEAYFVRLGVLHEDMHDEAFTYTRQTLSYAPPRVTTPERVPPGDVLPPGDARVPGGPFQLGAAPGEPFVFDNEKWAHPVELKPFRIARAPVTQEEFAAFVDAGGYRARAHWSEEGWAWREAVGAKHPVYWGRNASGGWMRRHFDRWIPLEPFHPVIHVSWYEAEAYCRWAKRRLPTEAEWEAAAAGEPTPDGARLAPHKRRFPWGDDPPSHERANLDWRARGTVDASALPAGDSAFGCRQMIGNVWEWTQDAFLPYPDFVADPYKEYSEPWFRTHRVLRGGCWTTRSRLIRNTWRNFYEPHRRDVLAGFRTCAL